MDTEKLRTGLTLVLIEDKVAIDHLYVLDIKEFGLFSNMEMRLKSLILKPNESFTFSLFEEKGWVLVSFDPFSDRPCYSQKGPFYNFESALHPDWVNCIIETKI